jgi:predicted kinase
VTGCRRAATILSAGHSVIADAVFADEAERDAIEASAKRSGAAFCGLWLEAPVDEMERRIEGRSRDASDATVEVLRRQQKYDLGRITWRRIEAGDGLTAVAARARATIRI